MKIAIKYGLLITAVVIVWVVMVRFLLDIGPNPIADFLSPVLFNFTAIDSISCQNRLR